jgi:hypothetical protein
MPLVRLFLNPGIDKQNTEYGAEGGWVDCDFVRFRYGLPEKLGGWTNFQGNIPTYFIGMASALLGWNNLQGSPVMALGTNRKLYAYFGGAWADITPIRLTTTPTTPPATPSVAFTATSGSNIVLVTNALHGALTGDFVTFSGAVSLGGNITADVLNQEYEITEVLGVNTYNITVPVTADGSDSGDGNGAVVAAYQINTGSDVGLIDFGWGTGTWGTGTWGTTREGVPGITVYPALWQFDLFGEDLLAQRVDGALYRWSPGTTNPLAVRAAGVSGAPTNSKFMVVSTPDRHVVCLGTESTVGTPGSQDPMLVRFSAQEDPNDFVETATNTAGGQRLTDGSFIVSAVRSRGQILIFTDTSLHGMQYVGPPYTFGFQQLGANCGCIGAHAAVDVNGVAYWMGQEAFYVFDGTVKKMPCTVQDYVFKDINLVQGFKVVAGINSEFNEVTWWYCSFTSDFVDRFVTYNYLENVWSIGSMPRTAWEDVGAFSRPSASEYLPLSDVASLSTIQGLTPGRSRLYSQESGVNADGDPIFAFIQSGYFDIADGENMLLMSRFIPDFKNQVGDLTVRLLLRAYPQATASPSSLDPYLITPTTQKVDTRARGRQISLKIESDALDTNWRFGTMRVNVQVDGLR